MHKVTIKLFLYSALFLLTACNSFHSGEDEPVFSHRADSLTESRIDSASLAIRQQCDTLMKIQVPRMVDSFRKDSALVITFFSNKTLYTDADVKVQEVVRQLLAECDSNLLKETYRIAKLQQKSKPPRRKQR